MSVTPAKPPFRETWFVAAFLACGALARVAWVFTGGRIKPVINESHNVAVALARTGRFADTFFPGQGPSAHVGMLTPLPSALAYWLFGADSRAAEWFLVLWSIALVLAGIWLCWRLASVLGMPPLARVAAVLFASLVPLQFGLELREGRDWEVNLATVLLVWILLRLVTIDRKIVVETGEIVQTAALAGLLLIISPPAGLAAVATGALLQIRHLPFSRWWIAPAVCLVVAGALAGFWAERNLSQLGRAVPLRDNLGLELDLSNHSGAVHPVDPHAAYMARLREIHPLFGNAAIQLHEVGEIAYYDRRAREAREWIRQHPGEFLFLSGRRLFQFFLPPRWFWFTFGAEGQGVSLRQAAAWASAIGGLLTLTAMAWLRRGYAYLLAGILISSVPYIFVQPILRYRYLVSTLLVFLACDGTVRVITYFVRNRAKLGHSSHSIPRAN